MRQRRRSIVLMACAGFVLGQSAIAQQPLSPALVYERLVAVVPMIGTGTGDDPFRPAYVPDYLVRMPEPSDDGTTADSPFAIAKQRGEAPKAILAFTYVLSDDERFGLVEFQATDRSAFEPLLRAARTPGSSMDLGLIAMPCPVGSTSGSLKLARWLASKLKASYASSRRTSICRRGLETSHDRDSHELRSFRATASKKRTLAPARLLLRCAEISSKKDCSNQALSCCFSHFNRRAVLYRGAVRSLPVLL